MAHRLSNDEAAFSELAGSGPDPRAVKFWDFERCQLRLEAFEKYLDVASRGEVVFAKFLAVVWFGRDRYGLDISDVATILDADARALVARWACHRSGRSFARAYPGNQTPYSHCDRPH